MKTCFEPAEILLPDFTKIDGEKWAVVACDQFTSQRDYWDSVEKFVGDAPSTLRLMLPEIDLAKAKERIPAIHFAMENALKSVLLPHPNTMIALERVQSDGKVRKGLIGMVDLECYDYNKGSQSLIRATEGTVLERIPPRVEIRRGAPIELPHVMLLIDDEKQTVIEKTMESLANTPPVYAFSLMEGGGKVRGWEVPASEQARIQSALSALISDDEISSRYGKTGLSPLLFAVGDGNHSLATAKASYEEVKAALGDAALRHPSRYALAEVVNLHDPALQFEPIYRVLFNVDPSDLILQMKSAFSSLSGEASPQEITVVRAGLPDEKVLISHPRAQIPVGTLQSFLDSYLRSHPSVSVDYIHGEDALRSLVSSPSTVGFLFRGMEKKDLFKTVIFDGALPRKTFSMGHARDKRYYIEARKIQ